MSEANNTASTAADVAAPEQTTTATPEVAAPAIVEPSADGEAPKPETAEEAATDAATTVAADEAKTDAVAETTIEPITQGQLAHKAPGLVKSLIPTKKEFWLSDDAVAPQNLESYLRGEKPDVSHAVVAWASQTGKGLLFINKKGETERTRPADVLALYDATDLKKQSPHEFSLRINGAAHTFKATSDAERDGWYLAVEKSIELGKASKEEIRESEGYKAELEKLNKPAVSAGAATRSISKSKKSVEVPAEQRTGSSDGETEDGKKKKSRSTSRGILNRLKSNKETEKKEEKEEAKPDTEAPILAETEAAPVLAGAAAAETPAVAAAQEELNAEKEKEAADTPAAEEKPKPTKRGSIFGRVSSTWGTLRSPAKEKDQKEVELKTEPAKDTVVSENAPQLPETATAGSVAESATPALEEPKAEDKEDKKEESAVSPTTEKNKFLSGIGGFMKRNRSVSPGTHLKESTKKDEPVVAPTAEETAAEPAAAVKPEEPVAEVPATATSVEPTTETPIEETKTEATTPNKRQSMLGSLGRRASKAINRLQAPKKENVAPAATEVKKDEAAEVKPAEEEAVTNGEVKKETDEQQAIGDVVPEAVTTGQQQQTPTVAATA